MRFVGERVRRVKDRGILTGRGIYVDDVYLPKMVHAAFVRSPFPHTRANIRRGVCGSVSYGRRSSCQCQVPWARKAKVEMLRMYAYMLRSGPTETSSTRGPILPAISRKAPPFSLG
jgi:DNA-binding Lrp family transcriptional regulator